MNPIELPFDILYLLGQQYPSIALSETNFSMNDMIKKIYDDATQFIIKHCPSLNHQLELTRQMTHFVKLVDELQIEVKRLNGEQQQPICCNLSVNEKILWGYFHYQNLVQEIILKTQRAQEEDFNTFIQAVAHEVSRVMLPTENARDVWKNLQENQLIQQITQLNLNNQGMRFLPPEIGLLTNLKLLYLENNDLKTLPLELMSLSQLQRLCLNHNKLETIPNDIHLPELRFFELRDNNLKQVPNLSAYPNLAFIHLHHNQIKNIPLDIDSHPNLNKIYLKDNPIKDIPNPLSSRLELTKIKLHISVTMTKEELLSSLTHRRE